MARIILKALFPILIISGIIIPKNLLYPENLSDEEFSKIENKIEKITLDNGLRILFLKQPYAPVAALYIKFLAGSADETDETAGIAHMLEHMLFKGTPRIGTTDYTKEKKYLEVIHSFALKFDEARRKLEAAKKSNNHSEAEKLAAEAEKWERRLKLAQKDAAKYRISEEDSLLYSIHGQRGYNAYTSRDLTNYQIRLPSNRTEVWARIESDRIKNSVLREFYTERNVVTEERRMRVENRPGSLLMEKYLIEVYKNHPYGRPLIGAMESIEYFNKDQAFDFYKTFYAPNNTVIAVVGNFDRDAIESQIRKYFSDWERQNIVREKPAPPEKRKNLVVEIEKEGSPVLYMSWFKPNMPDPDDLRLEILSRILADGTDSRLVKKLVLEKKLATDISIYTGFPGERFKNLFLIAAEPVSGVGYTEIEEEILNELQNVVQNGVTDEEMRKARAGIVSGFLFSLRSNAGLADRLSYYELLTGDYRNMFKSYGRLFDIQKEEVKQAAAEHLQKDYRMIARLKSPSAAVKDSK